MSVFLKLSLVLSTLLSFAYAADSMPQRGPVGFSSYDTNKDGVISEDEFNAHKAARMKSKADAGMPMRNAGNSPDFAFFDTNKDGKITPEELQKGQAKQMQQPKNGMGKMQY